MAQSDLVLVTGASGFVGSAVARLLVATGFNVRALMRAASARTHLQGLDLEFADADLRDPDAVARAAQGARFIFHVAASYRLSLRDSDELFASNVEGTRHVMRAALRAGVERVVYTSSVAALALRHDGGAADESELAQERETISAYKRSKLAAEKLVHAMIERDGLPAVVVNPTTPIGPFDVKPTPTGRIVVEAARGRMPGYVDAGLNVAHVEDVAAGHLAALRKGRIGERYILGGENLMLRDMLVEIAQRTGRSPPRWRLPRRLIYPIAAGAELAGWASGREPFVTINGLRMANHLMFFSSAKAERDLGYSARPWTQAIADALSWFSANGHLKP
jgi:dihydroflavonol-4-reductase